MAMRVTGRTRNGGLFADRRSPQAHALTKAPGATVHADWAVRNSSTTETGQATMTIFDRASVVMASFGPVGVIPGSTIHLLLDWVIGSTTPVGTFLEVNLVMFSGPDQIGIHPFTVNVVAGGGGGGNLAVIGEPLIT